MNVRTYREGSHGSLFLNVEDRTIATLDWNLVSTLKLLGLSVDDELCLSLACGPSLHLSTPIRGRLADMADRLRSAIGIDRWEGIDLFRLSLHDGAVWWAIVHSDSCWRATDPKWRSHHFNPTDFVFGEPAHTAVVLSEREVVVPMPEKSYSWKVKLLRREYRRPRSPCMPKVVHCYDAQSKEGEEIPVPGKGENSWDIGPDAVYSVGGPGRNVGDAVGSVVSHVMRKRIQYGGSQEVSV